MVELYTLDVDFDTLENLNLSVEEVRNILDSFKQKNKLSNYYIMRYNGTERFLGIKVLFENSLNKEPILIEIKENLRAIKGYKNLRQDKSEGNVKDNFPLICAISMEFRNKIWELLKRKPTDEEFIYITHYLANPLLLNYEDESRIKNIK